MTMTFGNWQVIGSVVQGANHIRQEKACQDALFLRAENDEKNFAIACVADGHGSNSCPYSGEGAAAAVKTVGEILSEIPPGLHDLRAHKDIRLPKLIEAKWKEEVQKIHAENERDFPTDENEPFPFILYGTTLIAVAATEKFIFALQIGDGNILMIDEKSARPVLAVAENVGEDTESLCLNDAWTYIRTQIIPWNKKDNPTMFLLSTDGYANSFADSSGFLKAGTDFFKLWQEEGLGEIEKNLPGWLRKSSDKGSGDDIAMAIMVC
jgi:serine/threonine protein phosphatase PrpC